SGDEWYFWCRRTGRGDLDSARKLMQSYLQAGWIATTLDGQLKLLTYHLLENNPKAALESARKAVELAGKDLLGNANTEYEQLHLAFIARELKQKDIEDAALKEIRRVSEEFRTKHPHFSATNVAICDILEGKTPSDDVLATIDQYIEKQPKEVRCNCEYFIGRAFDLAGDKDKAENYWKRCVTRGPFDRYNATLAGKYLCDRHKTSR
ncbi:MAG TPA: hypothetical protein VHE81_09810, partial [Lacipirellulaceae bacterium]|nr:hypothetical protein [Lacipirellulaceae bacterium]